MSADFDTIKGIARQSLMPDFFGARVDEEALWAPLKQVLTGLQPPQPNAVITKLKRLAGEATTASDFIEKLKVAKLWLEFKELVVRIQVK